MTERFIHSLKGQMLVAMPSLMDPNFARTVTCICEHTPKGAFGIVINRLQPAITLKDILKEIGLPHSAAIAATPVYIGGPVHSNEVFILHGHPFDWQSNLMVTPSMSMTNTRDILAALVADNGPEKLIAVIGCAGWDAGQIETEIMANAWLTAPIDEEIVYHASVEQRWELAMKRVGVDPTLFTGVAGHA